MHRWLGTGSLVSIASALGVSVSWACAPHDSLERAKVDPTRVFGLVVANSETTGCLSIKNDRIHSSETLSILVSDDDSTWVVSAKILKHRDAACEVNRGVLGDSISHYDVHFARMNVPMSLGFGVVTGKPLSFKQTDHKHVHFTIDSSKYELYDCASLEGLRFFVREGSKLIWHEYYYLAYDVESDCRETDFEDLKK